MPRTPPVNQHRNKRNRQQPQPATPINQKESNRSWSTRIREWTVMAYSFCQNVDLFCRRRIKKKGSESVKNKKKSKQITCNYSFCNAKWWHSTNMDFYAELSISVWTKIDQTYHSFSAVQLREICEIYFRLSVISINWTYYVIVVSCTSHVRCWSTSNFIVMKLRGSVPVKRCETTRTRCLCRYWISEHAVFCRRYCTHSPIILWSGISDQLNYTLSVTVFPIEVYTPSFQGYGLHWKKW